MAKEIKNLAKGDSYKVCFDRIKLSLEKGFPLEAICLIESILSDRLLSNAVGSRQLRKKLGDAEKTSFYELIKWFGSYAQNINDEEATELAGRLDAWRIRRNMLVHAAVRSYPKTAPKMPPSVFWKEAARVAREGQSHARALLHWHRRQLRAVKASGEKERT